MGVDARRPPLPPPTEPSTDTGSGIGDDVATDISRRTDRSSFSVPEDGSPVTIPTKNLEGVKSWAANSHTSLLIEYFEAGKNGDRVHTRPSVRVRVTPSSHRKSKSSSNHVQITETGRDRRPSYTRRISLGGRPSQDEVPSDLSYSEGSNLTGAPLDIEVLQHYSDLSNPDLTQGQYVSPPSDISSMPPDSMLDNEPVIQSPGRRRSRSLERDEPDITKEKLKAPTRRRSRSLSKERIAQRVMEKLASQNLTSEASVRSSDIRERRRSRDVERARSPRERRSRHKDDEYSSLTESSQLSASNLSKRLGDTHSVKSGSSVSINNPKLLQTVEDAIRRLILPELDALKEEQKTQKNKDMFEKITKEALASGKSREDLTRKVSKSSSAPNVGIGKPKVVLNRHGDDPGTVLSGDSVKSKSRRSSRGSGSMRSYDGKDEEKVHRRKSKDKHKLREAAAAGAVGAGLTAAALRHHDSQSEKSEASERSERRKRHSSSRSRQSESVDETRLKTEIPPLPLNSTVKGSDLTRESILTAESERPGSRSSRAPETPVREVSRGSPREVKSPTGTPRTPITLQRSVFDKENEGNLSAKSERSISAKARAAALSAAGLSKGLSYGDKDSVSKRDFAPHTPPREFSPAQSVASLKREFESRERAMSPHSPATSAGHHALRKESDLSIDSLSSPSSTTKARTRRGSEGASSERDVMSPTQSELSYNDNSTPNTPARDMDEFFRREHEENEQYRRELEQHEEGSRVTGFTEDSGDYKYDDRTNATREVKGVGAKPDYVHPPVAVESAVASLLDPSAVSGHSSASSPLKKQIQPEDIYGEGSEQEDEQVHEQDEQQESSSQRWGALKDHARALVGQNTDGDEVANSPRQSVAESDDDPVQMGATAFPTEDNPMPEIGYDHDDYSDVTTNPSEIRGPGPGYDRYPTPPMSSGGLHTDQQQNEGKFGAGSAAPAHIHHDKTLSPARQEQQRYQPTVEDEHEEDDDANYYSRNDANGSSPALWKDEGYISAHQPGGYSPEPQQLKYLNMDLPSDDGMGMGMGDSFKPEHTRHFSDDSHAIGSPMYDSATGKGMDYIQSKDIVALMDHLTVRDAQRNARDTEILVTLVRSAAEMRNSFEEMKKFIAEQDRLIMDNTDRRVGLSEQKILQGPRPQPLGPPRHPRRSTEDVEEIQAKRKNVFKRALKGLSMRSSNDLGNIESMLMQLLGEVEGLKETQLQRAPMLAPQNGQTHSGLTSYENLRDRLPTDPGYEPEGRANTASTPNQSGYLSGGSSRPNPMHSGFDNRRGPNNRVSTVMEGDEDLDEYEANLLDQFDKQGGLLTPTQDMRRNSMQDTPPKQPNSGSQSQDNTPKRKHKSNSSSLFGIPKISRWSKTTSSTNPEEPRNSSERQDRPYSAHSRSGSDVNITYHYDYELNSDDRFRSNTSLDAQQAAHTAQMNEQPRSPSPLIPDSEFDDPKYQAHRNSLNLQHPQPRPGPTGRHQSHLESQAYSYEPMSMSPDTDQWGSNPSLALNRHRLSGGRDPSPVSVSSEGGLSANSAAEQAINQASVTAARSNLRDDGPLVPEVPPKIPLSQAEQSYQLRSMYSSPGAMMGSPAIITTLAPIPECRYSLETDSGRKHMTPSPAPSGHSSLLQSPPPQRKLTGPRPMSAARSPSQRSDGYENTGTVRRKPVPSDNRSLRTYDSFESETF